MVDRIKKIVEAVGLIPTIVGYFKWTPQWFRPSPYLEPLIDYAAVFVALGVFVGTLVSVERRGGPAAWTEDITRRRITQGWLGFLICLLIGGFYIWFVRAYPYAGTTLDVIQIALWACFFGLATFFFTVFAAVSKAP